MRHTMTKVLLGAGMLLALVACQGENLSQGGKVVRFGARTLSPATRTAYSGEGTRDDASGNLTWERIDWVEGDEILIWSDKAVGHNGNSTRFATYQIDDITTDGNQSKASLSDPVGTGLVYVDGVESYSFWGLSPAAAASADPTDGAVTFALSSPQTGAATTDKSGNVTVSPAMDQAALLAAVTGVGTKETVNLNFYPAYTAFEFVLKGDDNNDHDIKLSKVEVIAENALTGSVSATLAAGTRTVNGKTIGASTFVCTAAENGKNLTFNFPEGTLVKKSSTLSFTVLALPQDIDGFTLKFYTGDDGSFVHTAHLKKNGSPITFGACEKHRIYGLAMPDGNWVLDLDLNVLPWNNGGTPTIDYTNAVNTTYFEFGDYDTLEANATIDNANWDITFNKGLSDGVVYVKFRINSPEGAEWSVAADDPSGWFKVTKVEDGDDTLAPVGTVASGGTAIVLKVAPNVSAIPATRSEHYTMILHTFIEAGGQVRNIDSETQNFDRYNKFAEFIIPSTE